MYDIEVAYYDTEDDGLMDTIPAEEVDEVEAGDDTACEWDEEQEDEHKYLGDE